MPEPDFVFPKNRERLSVRQREAGFYVRLDKYLKVSRLIKRRTVAKDVCDGEKIALNGRIAKPSAEVKPGDLITMEMRNRIFEARVLAAPNTVKASEAHTLYEVIRDERRAESER